MDETLNHMLSKHRIEAISLLSASSQVFSGSLVCVLTFPTLGESDNYGKVKLLYLEFTFMAKSSFEDTEKPDSGKGSKRRLTEDQIRLLETNFSFNKKLDQDLKYHLSQQLNLPPRQIAVWYQNKRARWKTQAMESNHKAMQSKLASVMSHNMKLEREVEKLQEELEEARAMLRASSTSVPAYSCAVSTSGEDDGGLECCLDNELYACVAGVAGVEGRHQFLSVAGGFGAFGASI